jgi:hypothetical protein
MITEYKIIKSNYNASELEQEVNQAIGEGWQPWGQPAVALSSNGALYVQALVKYSSHPDEWQTLNEEQTGKV